MRKIDGFVVSATFLPIVALVLLMFTSCRRGNNGEIVQKERTAMLHLNLSPTLRTTMTEGEGGVLKFAWTNADQLSIVLQQGTVRELITVSPKETNGATARFSFFIPNSINLQESYQVYGILNASVSSASVASGKPVAEIAALGAHFETLAPLAPKVVLMFSIPQANGLTLSSSLKHIGSVLCSQVVNQSNHEITIENLSIEHSQSWFYMLPLQYDIIADKGMGKSVSSLRFMGEVPLTVAPRTTVSRYSWFVPSALVMSTDLAVHATINGEDKEIPLREGEVIEAGKRFNVRVIYDGQSSIFAELTIPDMPSVDLF